MMARRSPWLASLLCLLLAGCAGSGGGVQHGGTAKSSGDGGRYSQSRDGYPDGSIDVSNVPDAVPRVEPRSASGNRSTYSVWGQTYHVMNDADGYSAVGRASFYGTKFHGYATASGEEYSMYRMTAAHKTLPLPTYVRVTNLANQRHVIVKVNDRGPFHDNRLIDLSYAAAARLDMLDKGTARVRVTAIDPVAWQRRHEGGTAVADRGSQSSSASQSTQADQGQQKAAQQRTSNENSVAHTRVTASPGATGDNGTRASREPAGETPLYLQVAALSSRAGAEALKTRIESHLDQPVRITRHAAMHRVQIGPLSDPIMVESVRSELRDAGFGRGYVVSAKD
ncbi:septal ring lytic transglycosylase RlpA family protein [Kushneria phosphatilytica]|nr:septal ring lytic transglycosylase RlpA family protein [Kushneria phosphatilytica]